MAQPAEVHSSFPRRLAWVLYDWANSGFGLIVVGPVFTPFFLRQLLPLLPGSSTDHGLLIAGTVLPGAAVMGILNSLSMALMALAAPVLGAIADIRGWTRLLLIASASTGSALAMGMFFLQPGQWLAGAILFVAANVCFGSSFTFYNAFLPVLVPPHRQGSLSGWGFAAGYVGGALALIIVLQMISHDPRLVPAGLAFSGAWWLLFSLPAFFLMPRIPPQKSPEDRGPLLLAGFLRIKNTLAHIRQYRTLFLFLLAFLLYNDGVETVISMSPAYGSDVLHMTTEQLIRMFLIVQFVAFAGAMLFGYLSDRIGNKTVIQLNLSVWVLAAVLAFFIQTPLHFTLLGILIGLVLGGVQAASRAFMASLAPEHIRAEAFGFFSISGKFASIFGPLLFSTLATTCGTRWGVLAILPFLAAGMIVLLFVRTPRSP